MRTPARGLGGGEVVSQRCEHPPRVRSVRAGSVVAAQVYLVVYSYTGLSSLGHFLSGSPDEFTTRGLISVLIDGAAGSAVLAVATWSILASRARVASPRARTAAVGVEPEPPELGRRHQ